MHKEHKVAYCLMKKNFSRIGIILLLSAWFLNACGERLFQFEQIKTGCEQTALYLPLLKGKSVAIVANNTSVIGSTHLVDSLVNSGVKLTKIFSPEHGFRGNTDAGVSIDNTVDSKTGIPITSLYGSKTKPTTEDLKGVDIVVYDIQDVGVRFYTYISTLHYVMEACAANNLLLVILDRPNPNGHYIDGPVLDPSYKSFIGVDPIPVVYGMTAGELARMINGERWLPNSDTCKLLVIPCEKYSHSTIYKLPVSPSPNINSMESVYLYPSVCFFEGTIMSIGRGTAFPFRVIGHPDYPDKSFSFIPKAIQGNKAPVFKDRICYGTDLRGFKADSLWRRNTIDLRWLLETYTRMNLGSEFFTGSFDRLAGTGELRKQILAGWSEKQIRQSWQADLEKYRVLRKKYLLYDDFVQ
jgi:uncharacterized protein YbbC (DUF1343 family)